MYKMKFRRITKLEIDGLVIRDCSQLSRFVQALDRIEAKPYHDKVPDSEEDFESIRRDVIYERPNRLNVRQSDSRTSGTSTYYVEF